MRSFGIKQDNKQKAVRFFEILTALCLLGVQIILPVCCHKGQQTGCITAFFKCEKSFPLAPCKSILNAFVYEI